MMKKNEVSDDIRHLTVDMERGPVKSNDVYTMLLRAMLEIDELEHRIKVLNDRKF